MLLLFKFDWFIDKTENIVRCGKLIRATYTTQVSVAKTQIKNQHNRLIIINNGHKNKDSHTGNGSKHKLTTVSIRIPRVMVSIGISRTSITSIRMIIMATLVIAIRIAISIVNQDTEIPIPIPIVQTQ